MRLKNIHFPTDLNLLWDSMRKCFSIIENWHEQAIINGWRKVKSNTQTLKPYIATQALPYSKAEKKMRKSK